jgi:Bacterial membrane protein YfhO
VRLREMMSFDLASLWPIEYTRVHAIFAEEATREMRMQLLRRGGVRYCFMREPLPQPDAVVLARAPNLHGAALYECNPHAARASVVEQAEIVPGREAQAQRLFKPEGGDDLVMLQTAPPPPAGTPGSPAAPAATFVRDDATVVEVKASAGANGGYLLLRDSYHPTWRVEVDGRPADMLRANLIFRAVRLAPGEHTVRFVHVPTHVYYGAAISGVAALGLLAASLWPARARSVQVPAPAPTVSMGAYNSGVR